MARVDDQPNLLVLLRVGRGAGALGALAPLGAKKRRPRLGRCDSKPPRCILVLSPTLH